MNSRSISILSLPFGGNRQPSTRAGRLALAAMFRAQACIMTADGDSATAQGLRRRARGIELRELGADIAAGIRLVAGVVGHA